jgi:hypothetical protein
MMRQAIKGVRVCVSCRRSVDLLRPPVTPTSVSRENPSSGADELLVNTRVTRVFPVWPDDEQEAKPPGSRLWSYPRPGRKNLCSPTPPDRRLLAATRPAGSPSGPGPHEDSSALTTLQLQHPSSGSVRLRRLSHRCAIWGTTAAHRFADTDRLARRPSSPPLEREALR